MGKIKAIVFSGPSGAGKTTIIKKIMEEYKDKFMFSVSHTTREKREGETDGKDYYFVSKEEFVDMIKKGDFVEWTEIYGNYYGTHKKNFEIAEKEGKILILDIDTKGAKKIMRKIGKDGIIFIFIKPPSIEELEKRLTERGEKNIKERIEKAEEEIVSSKVYDFIVENENLDVATQKIKEIINRFIGL